MDVLDPNSPAKASWDPAASAHGSPSARLEGSPPPNSGPRIGNSPLPGPRESWPAQGGAHTSASAGTPHVARDGLHFLNETVRTERIQAEDEYQGVWIHLDARVGSARIPLQVNVASGDVLTPPPKRVRLKTLPGFPSPALFVCPWETVMAEKFQALVELGMANSRMKNYFDLYHLANTPSVDGAQLTRAIRATFRRRRTPVPRELPPGLSPAFSSEPLKQAQWRAFVRHLSGESAPESLEEVPPRLREFLLPPWRRPLPVGRSSRSGWPDGPGYRSSLFGNEFPLPRLPGPSS